MKKGILNTMSQVPLQELRVQTSAFPSESNSTFQNFAASYRILVNSFTWSLMVVSYFDLYELVF